MPPKKGNTFKMPDPLPKNEVLTDTLKQKWILGPSIGKGGFGEVYAAAPGEKAPSKDSDYQFVVKIEPHQNGPLFVEKTFYLKAAKKDDVTSWMKKNKLKSFGMPSMHGNGSHECGSTKYRFLVMDRYAKDLSSIFESCNKCFPLATVLQISIQILDVLEYIHNKGYIHADIKASNLLLGMKDGTENQVYLVDFGLVTRISATRDPKKAHNGTIEYLSRDAHVGGTTQRSDMEILAYNMVHWLSSKLPWEGILKDCRAVQKAKESAMQNIPEFLKSCFGNKPVPGALSNYVEYVSKMNFDEAPDYKAVRQLFLDGLKIEGVKFGSPLSFVKPLELQNGGTKKVRTSPRKRPIRKETSSSKVTGTSELENLDTGRVSSEEEETKSKKKRKVTSKAKPKSQDKVSWRDCPTVKASGVTRPGEYVSSNLKMKKES